MKIAVYGAGYVGLVQAVVFASVGHEVTVVEIDIRKLSMLNQGVAPFFEPDLSERLEWAIELKTIQFTSELESTASNCELHVIAVGTPQDSDGAVDLSQIEHVTGLLCKCIPNDSLVIVKSTVPVGTTDYIDARLREALVHRDLTSHKLGVAMVPEFLREGTAVMDALNPDRVVIGTNSDSTYRQVCNICATPNRPSVPVIRTTPRTAELAKYAANCMLATRISFINEMAKLAELLDADISGISAVVGSDSRIGSAYLRAGIGYGGSCFPKDISGIISQAKRVGFEPFVLEAVSMRNKLQCVSFIDRIVSRFATLKGPKMIAVWGLAFKPGTDDTREAPSLYVIRDLMNKGFHVRVYDPKAELANLSGLPGGNIECAKNKEEVLQNAAALVILTEWPEFTDFAPSRLKKLLGDRPVFDGRNIYAPQTMQEHGVEYHSIGRRYA